jgi:hypothetical protein
MCCRRGPCSLLEGVHDIWSKDATTVRERHQQSCSGPKIAFGGQPALQLTHEAGLINALEQFVLFSPLGGDLIGASAGNEPLSADVGLRGRDKPRNVAEREFVGQWREVSAQAQKPSRTNFLGTTRNERPNRVSHIFLS